MKSNPWRGKSGTSGADSRRYAARALAGVREGQSLPDAFSRLGEDLPATERAFARRLALQVLRHRNQYEQRLKEAVRRSPKPAWIYELLLLGLAQLDDPNCPDHAAVSATVEAAPKNVRGLVNAILRRAGRGELALKLPQGEAGEAIAAALPPWLYQRIRKDWGDRAAAVISGGNEVPPFALRVNTQKVSREQYLEQLAESGLEGLPSGEQGVLLPQAVELARLPGFSEGQVSVQNPAAQCAAQLLSLEPGLRVLDACAAPGGKTAHLLEREPELELTALDSDGERLERVGKGLQRLGLKAELQVSRLQDYSARSNFARILLDVPCSASGVIRRHPDSKWLRREADIANLAREQADILRQAWTLLQPGGELLYASCSILLQETEHVVAEFVAAHADAAAQPIKLPVGEALQHGWRIPPGGPWDGFYYALLRKQDGAGHR